MSLYIAVSVTNPGGVCNIRLRAEGQWADIARVELVGREWIWVDT